MIVFFLVNGSAFFYLDSYRIVYQRIAPGTIFGDYEVITSLPRQHTTRTRVGCNFYTLSKEVKPALKARSIAS